MKRTYEIKKFPLWPVVKISFVIFLVIGIVIAVFYAILLSGIGFLASDIGEATIGEDFLLLQRFGLLMIPVIAFFYAVFGTIGVTICVLIYNLIAAVIGGIELSLEAKEPLGARTRPQAPPSGRQAGGEGAGTHVPDRPINGF